MNWRRHLQIQSLLLMIVQTRNEYYSIDTKGCRIQKWSIRGDVTINKLNEVPDPIKCKTEAPNIVHQRIDNIYINAKNYPQIKCCYRQFWRQLPKANESDTQIKKSQRCDPLRNNVNITIKYEFISVECKLNGQLHKYFFSFFPRVKVSKKLQVQKTLNQRSTNNVNVLMLGMDTMSRLNLHRQMEKTALYLNYRLRAIEMLGYNKVGINTYPNLMAVLTGLNASDVKKHLTKQQRYDQVPFIWNIFHNMSYVTAFAEDTECIGLFTYESQGFLNNPQIDYNYRMFNLLVEKEIGHTQDDHGYDICFGNDVRFGQFIQHTTRFIQKFHKNIFFGFFWSTALTHAKFAEPRYLDEAYFNFFKLLKQKNILNKTVVIFLSDHGYRFKNIENSSSQGYAESRLPILIMVAPDWFQKMYSTAWRNLRQNRKRLTTPFDLHETLIDLSNLSSLTRKSLKNRVKQTNYNKGTSLFLPMPEERTCCDAQIPKKYCACEKQSCY